jgi:hypothetical protein
MRATGEGQKRRWPTKSLVLGRVLANILIGAGTSMESVICGYRRRGKWEKPNKLMSM